MVSFIFVLCNGCEYFSHAVVVFLRCELNGRYVYISEYEYKELIYQCYCMPYTTHVIFIQVFFLHFSLFYVWCDFFCFIVFDVCIFICLLLLAMVVMLLFSLIVFYYRFKERRCNATVFFF